MTAISKHPLALRRALWAAVLVLTACGDEENNNQDPGDDIPPAAQVTIAPPPSVTGPDVTFEFTATANVGVAGFECQLDSGSFETCTSPHTYMGLTTGTHDFAVRAFDALGNKSGPQMHGWEVDADAPTGSATPSKTLTNDPQVAFALVADDAHGPIEMRLSGDLTGENIWRAFDAAVTVTLTAGDGAKTVSLELRDDLGNVGAPIDTVITLDQTPPDTQIDAAPAASSTASSATFTFSAVGDAAGFECRLDGEDFEPCTTPHVIHGVVGEHVFYVRALDAAGNADPTPAQYTWSAGVIPANCDTSKTLVQATGQMPHYASNGVQRAYRFTAGHVPSTTVGYMSNDFSVAISRNACDFTPIVEGNFYCGRVNYRPIKIFYSVNGETTGCPLTAGEEYYFNIRPTSYSNGEFTPSCSGACTYRLL